ncbi:hypothetical protein FISHEDRAFT_39848 [Fistulina hepatica ATCC 64428]|uniref:Non-structural maintenance of chromosomes element 4 n=1 Tax=Fistulina hepatica ATCC 64428 TaxID=1128425 RepID=A0A0D7AFP4_9AGAR|nr:hypothetical protein FISHEDRAFT_39848 [Fistulina hepatica ATCC 64428]
MGAGNIVYDPDQNADEKREVRKGYRTLARHIEENQTNLNEITAEQLSNELALANKLFDRVKAPQEAALDSQFLLMASTMGAQKARAMKSGSGSFDIDDFVAKLITFMGGRQPSDNDENDEYEIEDGTAALDWDKIGRKALAKSRRVPTMTFMLGPLSIEQKQRTQVKRAKFEKNEEDRQKPQEIREEDIQRSANETSHNVALAGILENVEKVNLFRFIVNPKSFAQSVENLFYLSFLIRDGVVALETEKDGEPIIFACEPPSDHDRLDSKLQKRQMVMELDMATWKYAIEVFDITESIIPHRQPPKTKIGDKWYG